MTALSPTQERALALLRSFGKVTEATARREGFQVRTFNALVKAGYARTESRPGLAAPRNIFFPKEES